MKTWYVHRGGHAIGPVSREQIAAAIIAGKVFDDDLFCEVGGRAWSTGTQIPELRELWTDDEVLQTAERILADSGAMPLDFDDLEPISDVALPALPAPGRPVVGSASRSNLGATEPRPAIGPTGPAPDLPPAPTIDEQAPTELFSRETLPPELSPSRPPPSRARADARPNPDSTVRMPRSERVHRWVTVGGSIVIVVLAVSLTVYALMTHSEPAVVTADPTPRGSLPAPFDALSIGMSREDLEAQFPPSEAIDSCRFAAIEDSARVAPQRTAHSRCIDVAAVAGVTPTERARIVRAIREHSSDAPRPVLERGHIRALAHVRGASRAELVEDRQLLEAFGQTGASLPETVFGVSTVLAEGTLTLFSQRSLQRHVGAMLDDECSSIAPERLVDYVGGELDVRRSRCSRQASSQQDRFAASILEAGGAFAPIGFARASGNLDDRRVLRSMRRESGLDETHADLALHLARQSDALEDYFRGAIVLMAEPGAQTTWSYAIAWLDEDRVTRLLLSLRSGENIERLENFLGPELGHGSSSDPSHIRWDGSGWHARLDHAALALIVEAE